MQSNNIKTLPIFVFMDFGRTEISHVLYYCIDKYYFAFTFIIITEITMKISYSTQIYVLYITSK